MWSYKDHGKDWDAVYNRAHPPGFRWVHDSFGTNWRMLEVQAAIGLIQLGRMADWTARRTAIANRLTAALAPFAAGIRVPLPAARDTHAYYRHYAYARPEGLRDGWDRDRLVAELASNGVAVLHGTCPEVYLERAFDGTPWRPAQRLPGARELGETSLMFLTHPSMPEEEVDSACATIERVLGAAVR
jgi:dTDP-4-amino-4,6-dideoxygalactose transaminase